MSVFVEDVSDDDEVVVLSVVIEPDAAVLSDEEVALVPLAQLVKAVITSTKAKETEIALQIFLALIIL